MEKFSDVKAYLTLPEDKRDIQQGIQLYAKYYKNKTYLQFLERRRRHQDVNYKLEKLLKDNDIAIPEIDPNAEPSGSQPAATGKPDAGQGKEGSESGEGGAVEAIELSDEVKAFIEVENAVWKEVYKIAGGDHAVMVHIANSLESGDKSEKLADLVASLDAAFTEKLQKHWDNIEFAKTNNAIPSGTEKKETAIDVSALDNLELVKKRSNARTAVSKYKKSGNEEKHAEHQALLDALDAEIKKRDLKA